MERKFRDVSTNSRISADTTTPTRWWVYLMESSGIPSAGLMPIVVQRLANANLSVMYVRISPGLRGMSRSIGFSSNAIYCTALLDLSFQNLEGDETIHAYAGRVVLVWHALNLLLRVQNRPNGNQFNKELPLHN